MKIKTLLIANRGEIARRIAKGARALEINIWKRPARGEQSKPIARQQRVHYIQLSRLLTV